MKITVALLPNRSIIESNESGNTFPQRTSADWGKDRKMRKFTTQLLNDETKEAVKNYDNVVVFANEEEEVYLNAMTRAKDDMIRRKELVNAFNESVLSFARNYAKQ